MLNNVCSRRPWWLQPRSQFSRKTAKAMISNLHSRSTDQDVITLIRRSELRC